MGCKEARYGFLRWVSTCLPAPSLCPGHILWVRGPVSDLVWVTFPSHCFAQRL